MKIHFSPTSPYVRKCLVSAHELGLEGQIQLLPSSAHPVNRDQEIIKSNPLGKVPTFNCDGGTALFDSRVICEYLDDKAGGKLFPRSGSGRWVALTQQSLGDGILDAALLARYESAVRPEPLRWPDRQAGQLDKIETSLAHLEAGPQLPADRVDIGLITIGCALWYLDLRFADMGWRSRFASVAAWYAEFGQRESMKMIWAL